MPPSEDRADGPPESSREWLSWNVLAGAPKWWFRAEVPPTLGPAGTWERVIRTSVLMGLLGLAASWLSTVLILALSSDQSLAPMGLILLLFVNPGTVYALVVILPWSIWMRLPLRWAILTIPFCAAFALAVAFTVFVGPDPGHPNTAVAVFAWPAGILWWCTSRSTVQTNILTLICIIATGLACLLVHFGLDSPMLRSVSPVATWAVECVRYSAFLAALSVPVSITLGSLLWKMDR